MRIKGSVFTGVLRGQPLMELYFHRITGMVGFEPYKGTMDVELERPVDIKLFSTRTLDHVLMDGTRKTDAYLAPIDLIFNIGDREQRYRCWAMQQVGGPYGTDVIEIVAQDMLRDKFGLKDGDELDIEFFSLSGMQEKRGFVQSLSKLKPHRKTQLMKR